MTNAVAAFIIIMSAIWSIGWWMNRLARTRREAAAAAGDPEAAQRIERLSGENSRLRGQVSRLEERLAVLERIATDPAERTAREIESLR